MVKKTVSDVSNYIVEKFIQAGVKQEHAKIVADCLVFADARGTKSHGVNMLQAYLHRIRDKGVDLITEPTVESEDASFLKMNANNGLGQVAAFKLTQMLIKKIENVSIVCGSIKNMNHCGALAYYTEMAARAGYIAMLFANANPTVAPFQGMEAVLGTNPLSFALPTKDSPIVLDMATSTVAKAKIYHCAKNGETIDSSWALDAEGNPTTDAHKAIKGVLTSVGGPKGYGLSVVVECLAGVLSGGGITSEIASVHKGTDKSMNAGCFLILIRPSAFMDMEQYYTRIHKLIDDIKKSKPQLGKNIYMPGEIEINNYKNAVSDGITYDDGAFELE